MKSGRTIGRIAALVSAVALVGGYVTYRAIARSQQEARAAKDATHEVTTDSVFVGTKSGPVFTPPPEETKPEFIGGSKSMRMADPEDIQKLIAPPATQPAAPQKQEQPQQQKPKG